MLALSSLACPLFPCLPSLPLFPICPCFPLSLSLSLSLSFSLSLYIYIYLSPSISILPYVVFLLPHAILNFQFSLHVYISFSLSFSLSLSLSFVLFHVPFFLPLYLLIYIYIYNCFLSLSLSLSVVLPPSISLSLCLSLSIFTYTHKEKTNEFPDLFLFFSSPPLLISSHFPSLPFHPLHISHQKLCPVSNYFISSLIAHVFPIPFMFPFCDFIPFPPLPFHQLPVFPSSFLSSIPVAPLPLPPSFTYLSSCDPVVQFFSLSLCFPHLKSLFSCSILFICVLGVCVRIFIPWFSSFQSTSFVHIPQPMGDKIEQQEQQQQQQKHLRGKKRSRDLQALYLEQQESQEGREAAEARKRNYREQVRFVVSLFNTDSKQGDGKETLAALAFIEEHFQCCLAIGYLVCSFHIQLRYTRSGLPLPRVNVQERQPQSSH